MAVDSPAVMVNDSILHEPLGDPCDDLLGEYTRRMADRGGRSLENPADSDEWSLTSDMATTRQAPRARRSGPPPSTLYRGARTDHKQVDEEPEAGVKKTTRKGETKNLVEHNPAIVERILEELMGPEPVAGEG